MDAVSANRRGRPKKPRVAKEKRARGRPFKDKDNLYSLALLQAADDLPKSLEISERSAAETLVKMKYALRTLENFEAMARGEGFYIKIENDRTDKTSVEWRHRNPVRPIADDNRRKLNRIRKQDIATDKVAEWVAAMSLAWGICLRGRLHQGGRRVRFFGGLLTKTLAFRSPQKSALGATFPKTKLMPGARLALPAVRWPLSRFPLTMLRSCRHCRRGTIPAPFARTIPPSKLRGSSCHERHKRKPASGGR
jgi:hypothetical protein